MKIKSNFKNLSSLISLASRRSGHLLSRKGFTLIELLIVIAIIGILAAGILVAIDPIDKINAANDARVQSDIGVLASASEAYATVNGGFYPGDSIAEAAVSTYDGTMVELKTAGELKVLLAAPTGYTYTIWSAAAGVDPLPNTTCIAGRAGTTATCARVVITSTLKSKKFKTKPFQRYESYTGKTCQVAANTTVCP